MFVAMLANRNTNSQNKQVGNNTNQSGKKQLMSSLHSRNQFQFQQNINVNTYFQINITMDMLTFNVGGWVYIVRQGITFRFIRSRLSSSNAFQINQIHLLQTKPPAHAHTCLTKKKKRRMKRKRIFYIHHSTRFSLLWGKLKMHNVGK